MEELIWKQKSRTRCPADGDRNTSCYQAFVQNNQYKENRLCWMLVEMSKKGFDAICDACKNYLVDIADDEEGIFLLLVQFWEPLFLR